ncbi:hypothetical protein HG530_007656 [Fusarium avenaceum]|nr:hypothetical protein HG530_007656 [Fusarium avenaceum]
MEIPPLSLTVVAPRLNSLSSAGTFSMISAKQLTYTAPPSRPSQKTTKKTMYTEGRKKYTAWKLDGDGLRAWRQGHHEHASHGQSNEYEDSRTVGNSVDKVRGDQLGQERGDDIGEENDALGERADEVLGSGEDYHVEDIVYKA